MHLGLIGYGSIATSLVERLASTPVTRLSILVRAGTNGLAPFDITNGHRSIPVQFVTSCAALINLEPKVVVECAGHAAVQECVPLVLMGGIDVIVASLGALADSQLQARVNAAARQGKSEIIYPSGAIGGLDLLRAISQAGDIAVTYRGIKPAEAWKGTPAETLIDLDDIASRTVFFSGTGRAAAIAFPKNANVVAALALAGAGFDDLKVELVADPNAQTNIHAYEVISAFCSYKLEIENTATPGNARTSITTVLSILHDIMTY
jgi:aspartate dehydrogenase